MQLQASTDIFSMQLDLSIPYLLQDMFYKKNNFFSFSYQRVLENEVVNLTKYGDYTVKPV